MAKKRRRAERVEPVLRRRTETRADLEPRVRDGDRTTGGGGRRASGGNRPRGRARTARGSRRKQKRGFIRRTVRLGLIALGVMVIAGGAVVAYYAAKLPDLTSWAVPERPPNIQIRASDGTVIANRGDTGGENVTLEELPEYVAQAIIAIEDRRFYGHVGVDPIGLARVLVAGAQGDRLTGASTITQQLARTLFLSLDRTFERKMQEAILAVWLEIQYSKHDLLEMYLNRVYFGGGAYGIDAAAHTFFGKPASRLTLAEAATLAGLLPAPSRYAPNVNPDAARTRQLLVLNAMVEEGYITAEQSAAAAAGAIVTVEASVTTGSGGYVADWVADLVPDFIGAIQGDIVVETTIDMALQQEAATDLAEAIAENGEALDVSQGALVSVATDGAIRVLVGGISYQESQFNRAVNAHRQPGSSFKPFVYLTALERGLTPETIRVDQPVNINGWTPENYSQEYMGPVTLQRALALSLNTISAQLTQEVGAASVVQTARRLGISSPLQSSPSIALGTFEVTPLEMTAAFVPFANGGYGVVPYVIERIRTVDGDILYDRESSGFGQIIAAEHIGMLNAMLEETLATGTGRAAVIPGWVAAGKTGTSQEFRDAWFIGYTANLVTGVWVGNDDNSPTNRASGGNLPTQIWSRFMTAAHEGIPAVDLPGDYTFRDPANFNAMATPQSILGPNGVYDEYLQQWNPGANGEFVNPPAGAGLPNDQFIGDDPRLNPQLTPPAPVGGVQQGVPQPVYPQPQYPQPVYVPPPEEERGFFRRLFGG